MKIKGMPESSSHPHPSHTPSPDELIQFHHHLPFQVRKYQYVPEPEPYGNVHLRQRIAVKIDPGRIPPFYTNTWAIDVRYTEPTENDPKPVESFVLDFEDLNLDLDEQGDRLTIIDSAGIVIKRYMQTSELSDPFFCSFTDYDTLPFKRLYLILETYRIEMDRRMVIKGLRTNIEPPLTAEVLLLEDDINYETNNPFVNAWSGIGPDAEPIDIIPPWTQLGSDLDLPGPPLRSEGWYLVGENVTFPDPQFYTLLYYNEYTSTLRIYLYNLSLGFVASGHRVEVALCGETGVSPGYLYGAFFPVDPNPDKWGRAVLIVPHWAPNKWTMVEIPMLYPMGSNLPIASYNRPQGGGYNSLYEDELEPWKRNVRLRITVIPYLQGPLDGDVSGEAIGEAVQKFGATSLIGGVFGAFKNGLDWYKGASDFSKWADDWLKKPDHQNSSFTDIVGVLGKGAGYVSGPLAAAGAAVSLYETFFAQKEPLKLAIQLALQEKVTGTVNIPLTPISCEFYLPGNFSILEAFQGSERLPTYSRRYIDSRMPRYDRTMGLFGFAQNPGTIQVAISRRDHWPYDPEELYFGSPVFIVPCGEQGQAIISAVLPVIYNPFAGIVPNGNSIACKFFFEDRIYRRRISWETSDGRLNLDPLISEDGLTLTITQPCAPALYRTFQAMSDLSARSTVYYHAINYSTGGFYVSTYYDVYELVAHATTKRDPESWAVLSFDSEDLSPMHDAIYYWDATYEVADRQGQSAGVKKVKLKSPVSLNIARTLWKNKEYGANPEFGGVSPEIVGELTYSQVKSTLLRS